MKLEESRNSDSTKIEELQMQVSELKQKLDEANVLNQAMWSLLVDISKRLQLSSAAIKAAVSSLLDYDIFWDGSTQHELLEIIDSSTDQVSDQITLLSLAFRSESKSLEIRPELNAIPEILSSVLDAIADGYPGLDLNFDISADSSPVFVDYEYLSVALRLLFEVIADTQPPSQPIQVVTGETPSDWHIQILGVNGEILAFISTVSDCFADEFRNFSSVSSTNKLKLLVMCKILSLQSIHIGIDKKTGQSESVQLAIPLGIKA